MLPTDAFFSDLEQTIQNFAEADRPRLRKLITELENIANRVPRVAERCYAYQARLFAKLQEYEQALAAVERAVQLAPMDNHLVILRGDIYREAEEFSKALQNYSKVVEEHPEAVTARIRRSDIHQAAGDYEHALADINEALKHEPRSLRLIYRRGLILVNLRRWQEALADFRTVRQLSPEPELKKKAEQRLRELGER
jgi:tetratricopeptide (TPR) repeat protein